MIFIVDVFIVEVVIVGIFAVVVVVSELSFVFVDAF